MTSRRPYRLGAALALVCALGSPALALSQIGAQDGAGRQREGIVSVPLPPLAGSAETPAGTTDAPENEAETTPTGITQPATTVPDGAAEPQPAAEDAPAPGDPGAATGQGVPAEPLSPLDVAPSGDAGPPAGEAPAPLSGVEESAPSPPVVYGDEGLPEPVRRLRESLIAVAKSGEIEGLRPYIAVGEDGTLLSFGGTEGDPIAFLKSASGDGEGVEILAILLEILQAGHVRNEPASDDEIFVWPYFTSLAIDKLTKPQKVELFELVTAGDYQEMVGFGAYNFYRLGISPDGKLQFFVAGD